jgi:type VI secretion system protein ImpF
VPSPGEERTVRQSLLDRLIEKPPKDGSEEGQSEWAKSVKRYRKGVRRDLEWLLNTRRIADPAPDSLKEVSRSLYHFGFPDITSLSRDAKQTRDRLLQHVRDVLEIFEPRLDAVQVTLTEMDEDNKRQLRFMIEATLLMDPNPERVMFDTVLEIASGEYHVKGDRGA